MGALKVWDGSAWQTLANQGRPGSNVFVGPSTPPGSPTSGDMWYDTDEVSGLTMPITLANGGTGGTSAITARSSLATPQTGSSASVGAPTTGTYAKGDQWIDSTNAVWICTAAGTPGTWLSLVTGLELSYTQITTNVSVATNTEATAQEIISSGARTYDGTSIWIEFFAPRLEKAAGSGTQALVTLWDGTTNLGWLDQRHSGTNSDFHAATSPRRKLTPTAGTHTYRICVWAIGGTAVVHAGTGAAGGHVPAFLRVTRG